MIALSLLIGLLLYILFAWFAVRVVGWLANVLAVTATTKRILQIICVAIFVLIPTWDIIPGRLYFQHLCEREAGIKVLRIVEIEKAYFRSDGQPDREKLAGRYVGHLKANKDFSRLFHISKFEEAIEDKQTGEVLGTATSFSYFGGWVNAFLFPHGPPNNCPAGENGTGLSVYAVLWREVMKPKSVFSEGGN